MDANVVDFISCQLRVERTPVTAVLLSRDQNITTIDAANCLEQFFQRYKDDPKYPGLDSKYSVCGLLGDKMVVKIVDGQEMEKVRGELSEVTKCQMFSIQMSKDVPLSSITHVNASITKEYNTENMIKWGVLLTETDGAVSSSVKVAPAESSAPMPQPQVKPKVKQEEKPVMKSPVEVGSRYVSRKSNASPVPVAPKPRAEYVSRKRKSGVVADTAVAGDEEDIDTSVTKKTKVLNTAKPTDEKLLNLFGDDDEQENDKFSDDEPTPVDVESPPEQPKTAREVFLSQKNEPAAGEASSASSALAESVQPVEEVAEFERIQDADGFITMKRNTPTPKHNPAKAAAAKEPSSFQIKKPKTAAPKKQASLMNFFKKK